MRLTGYSVLAALVWCLGQLDLSGQPISPTEHPLKLISPAEGEVLDSFLTAVLRWEYPPTARVGVALSVPAREPSGGRQSAIPRPAGQR